MPRSAAAPISFSVTTVPATPRLPLLLETAGYVVADEQHFDTISFLAASAAISKF